MRERVLARRQTLASFPKSTRAETAHGLPITVPERDRYGDPHRRQDRHNTFPIKALRIDVEGRGRIAMGDILPVRYEMISLGFSAPGGKGPAWLKTSLCFLFIVLTVVRPAL